MKNKTTPGDAMIYEPLLDMESSVMFFLCEPAITTLSFYQKASIDISLELFKKRLHLICESNPWVCGRLIKDKAIEKGRISLAVPTSIKDEDIDAIFGVSNEKNLSSLSLESDFGDLCTIIGKSQAVVPIGYNLIGKDKRVSKFTLVENTAKDEIMLIASICHAVSDGFTYYKILSMLTEGNDISPLSFRRKHEFSEKMEEAIGAEEFKLSTSTGMLLSMLPTMICKSPAYCHARFVDSDQVKRIKEEAMRRTSPSTSFACSTNDILVSTFVQSIPANLVFMAINLRERISIATNTDAGNYETAILYDKKSTKTPESVRASLQGGLPYKRFNGDPLPKRLKLLRSKYGIITNWAFPEFQADLTLRTKSNEEVPMTLHLPMMSPSNVFFPFAIIFKANKDQLAILYMGSKKDLDMKKLESNGAPLGASVNEKMFSC
ncbi:hypothetical protein CTEN210_03449 [Chaetoceros tenuissimus]|uniref:Uncharacterized protein n=1 Tax=Chaetoceros tenuissimus TaxID=426638 RepID=A0AAD3CJS7_9STRA|nr:hypothetical protein CTEN210_03449 [Chaetoceros tenuissimus]